MHEPNINAARASLEEVVNKNPEDFRAIDLMILTYYYQNQQAAVAPKLREYAQKYPKSAVIQTRLGEWLLASGDRKQALSVLAAADTLNPKYLPAKMAHARAETAMGNLKEAQKILSAMVDLNRQFTPAGLLLGDVDAISGDRSMALQQYAKVLETDPSNVLALNNTAFLLADFANKPDEALKYAERAKELAPNNPEIEDTLGWVLYRKGVYDVALKHLNASVATSSTPQREYHLAMTYFKLGNRKKGQEVLQTALRQDPNLPEAKLALELQAQLPVSQKP
jgi:tetratricopeptide (TPR) repeat protein